MLEVKELTVAYDDIVAVNETTFHVKEGEIVAIVGSNGAGKTTVVNAISGLISISSGNIFFQSEPIGNKPSHKIVELGLIQVPEGRKVFPKLSVRENLRLGSYLPVAKMKRNETMDQVFQLFPILKKRESQNAGTLSGGEQQMLALGRGLMSQPKLLMLDEPSLGLAPLIINLIFETTVQINKLGTTILLVEQNTFIALNTCGRAYVMENGKIVLEGIGNELLNNAHVIEAYLGV